MQINWHVWPTIQTVQLGLYSFPLLLSSLILLRDDVRWNASLSGSFPFRTLPRCAFPQSQPLSMHLLEYAVVEFYSPMWPCQHFYSHIPANYPALHNPRILTWDSNISVSAHFEWSVCLMGRGSLLSRSVTPFPPTFAQRSSG